MFFCTYTAYHIYLNCRSVKKNKKQNKRDSDFDKNIKPLRKTIIKKKHAKELNKILKSKVKMLELKENSINNDVFNKDLWSSYRGMLISKKCHSLRDIF